MWDAASQALEEHFRCRSTDVVSRINIEKSNMFEEYPLNSVVVDHEVHAGLAHARIPVPVNGRMLMVNVEDIRALKSAGNYVEIHTEGRPLLFRSTLSAVEERLANKQFVRVHRSTIANLSRVVQVVRKRSGGCQVKFDSGLEISVSRTYAERVRSS